MSKKLREQCGYSTAQQKSCGNCGAFTFTIALSKWMKDANERRISEGERPTFTIAKHGQEKLLRCGKHGFAVTKNARCDDWHRKED